MPKFVSERDYAFFQHINREIITDIVDVQVILYKMLPDITHVNIYGESTSKARYRGVELEALVKYSKQTPSGDEGFGYDTVQEDVEFRFVRYLLERMNVYPETGDIIGYNNYFYEIDNITEAQLIASRAEFNHSVICETHLTRKSGLNIVETHT